MTTGVLKPPAAPPRATALLARVAFWLEIYSQAAVRIATVGAFISALIALLAIVVNVFVRQVLGFSLFGANELASFAFLWTIWLGVSLAVKRGAVTVITLVSGRGPEWWRASVRAFSGVSLGVFLAYACWRTTQFALGEGAPSGLTPTLQITWFYPVVSMTVGYYFITLHYLQQSVAGGVRLAERGRAGLRLALVGLAGGVVIGATVWAILWLLLQAGAAPLVAIGVLFVALTLAGTPIVFMLAIIGIIALFSPSFLGLSFYPSPDAFVPFSVSQFTMGLSGGTELPGDPDVPDRGRGAQHQRHVDAADRLRRLAGGPPARGDGLCLPAHLGGGLRHSGSAQADAAIMTPLLVPAMEREGYRRDVAAAVVAGASIKGPIGPLSIMFIVYAVVVQGPAAPSISKLLLSGLAAELLLLVFQAATVYVVVRRMDLLVTRRFAGVRTVARTGVAALPVLLIPVIILGGIFTGVFTASESGAIAAVAAIALALFGYASISPLQLPAMIVAAAVETGVVMLLLGDSSILAKALFVDGFGQSVQDFLTGITDNKYVFLLIVNVILLAVGLFIEPLPALYILAPFLAPVAVLQYGIDPAHFGLIMVFNLVLALIHPPIGLVIFLVSSIAKVSVERLSVMILPWLAVSLLVLFLITYLPSEAVLALSNLID